MKKHLDIFGNSKDDNWGGIWTEQKMEIFLKYVKAYLTILNKYPYKLIYFDGFAGSGIIQTNKLHYENLMEGIASRVLSINRPKGFDFYYMVEKNEKKSLRLRQKLKIQFPDKERNIHVVNNDCNVKLVDLCNFLKKNKNHRALAILDPYGMALEWKSLEGFKDLGCDMWILVPTGVGVNRLLTKSGEISEGWMLKLTAFLGLEEEEIKKRFYHTRTTNTLFGEEKITTKVDKAIQKIVELYADRLGNIWKHVSTPHAIRNTRGTVIFHFILVSQVKAGVKIADEITRKY